MCWGLPQRRQNRAVAESDRPQLTHSWTPLTGPRVAGAPTSWLEAAHNASTPPVGTACRPKNGRPREGFGSGHCGSAGVGSGAITDQVGCATTSTGVALAAIAGVATGGGSTTGAGGTDAGCAATGSGATGSGWGSAATGWGDRLALGLRRDGRFRRHRLGLRGSDGLWLWLGRGFGVGLDRRRGCGGHEGQARDRIEIGFRLRFCGDLGLARGDRLGLGGDLWLARR